MDFFAELKRITRQHCEAMGYAVADCYKDMAAPQVPAQPVSGAPSQAPHPEPACAASPWETDLTIPSFLLKRYCSWCATWGYHNLVEPDSDLCYGCNNRNAVPQPWKE